MEDIFKQSGLVVRNEREKRLKNFAKAEES